MPLGPQPPPPLRQPQPIPPANSQRQKYSGLAFDGHHGKTRLATLVGPSSMTPVRDLRSGRVPQWEIVIILSTQSHTCLG